MKSLGQDVAEIAENPGGSTDMGNVSLVVPSIHPSIAISSQEVPAHTSEFAAAAGSNEGMKAMIVGGKALAMTAADVIGRSEFLARIKEEFNNTKQSE